VLKVIHHATKILPVGGLCYPFVRLLDGRSEVKTGKTPHPTVIILAGPSRLNQCLSWIDSIRPRLIPKDADTLEPILPCRAD
jgi:hypothetical protein